MIEVSNIERFATHDGDGIRTVVFLKGCPLHCPWCANPETQEIASQLLYDQHKCIHCHTCEQGCPQHAISFLREQFQWDEQLCTRCSICEKNCPQEAIRFAGTSMSVEDIMVEIRKDKDYYDHSSGGVTISGGEAYVQFKGFLDLLKACKEERYHVCVETSGQVPLAHIQEADPFIDLYYFDIKHLDEQMYQKTIGGNLATVVKNMNYLVNRNPEKVVFRVPVIPGFNNQEELLCGILDLAKDKGVKEVHFLPYHTLGKVKYEKMLKTYAWQTKMMDEHELDIYLDIAKSKGVNLKIGG